MARDPTPQARHAQVTSVTVTPSMSDGKAGWWVGTRCTGPMRWSLRRSQGGISGTGAKPSDRSSRIKVGASSRTGRESTVSAPTRLLFGLSGRTSAGLSRGARSSARRTARYRRATRRRRKKKKKAQATNLKAGASGVALLLLGTIVGRRLASRALSSRRFALAASHCAALLVDARGGFGDEVEKKVVEINRREKLCGCGG